MNKPSRHFTISAGMARQKDITRTFDAAVLIETERAYYLYGHGTTDPEGRCARCARRLTHPGSVLIGIGPECLTIMTAGLDGWEMRAKRFNFANPDPVDVEELKSFTSTITIDGWFPKAAILSQSGENGSIQVPDDHPKLPQAKPADNGKPTRTASIDTSGKFVIVKFPYDATLVDQVRRLEGRRWNGEKKWWSAWASVGNLTILKNLDFQLDSYCEKILFPLNIENIDISLEIPGLMWELRNFQKQAVSFIDARNGRALVADDMGLGKTIESLAWLQLRKREALPCLILCPASVKINWLRECHKGLTGITAQILEGRSENSIWADVAIANYDIIWRADPCPICEGKGKNENGQKCGGCKGSGKLIRLRDELAAIKWKTVIADECHKLNNTSTQRFKAAKPAIRSAPFFLPMSATPIENKADEFYTILNLIDQKEWNSWKRYVERYCDAKKERFGWNTKGSSNRDELHQRLQKIMIRRHKKDVAKDLPEKTRYVILLEIDNRPEYTKAECNFLNWIRENLGDERAERTKKAEIIAKFTYLKRLASKGKFDQAVAWIEDTLESVDKILIFTSFQETLDKVKAKLFKHEPAIIDGRVSITKRQAEVDRFQNDPSCRVFIGNTNAAGLGLTLTAAHTVVHMEYEWKSTSHDQAEDRGLRIGQISKEFNVYYLLAYQTIEEEIAEILDEKRKVLDAVLDGQETAEESMITELLKRRMEG